MADTPVGVPGDATRDGVASSRAVVPVTDVLRNLAEWLEAHPAAEVHNISLNDVWLGCGPAVASNYTASSVDEMHEAARGLDSRAWNFRASDTAFVLGREIVPGVRFEFFLSRAKLASIEDAA